jgi:deoxyribodipyrimidine photo-lyase
MFTAITTKQELLDYLATFDVADYAKTRNHLSGTVSRLSPFITRGVITLPEIRAMVLKNHSAHCAEKFIQELAWREYWQQVWFEKGNDIFTDLRFPRDDWAHDELVAAVVEAKTGIPVLDSAIKDLELTGYMHNHARMWVAMLACNVGKAHWFNMSRWLYYHLRDGDLASNMLSWQRYVANQAVINSCSDKKELRTYLTMPCEEVGTGDIPAALRDSLPFAYTMQYPHSEAYNKNAETVFLYSPWTLDPDWRAGEVGERILLIEPSWFGQFPVSPAVLNFIITVARTQIPDIKAVTENASALVFSDSTEVFSRAYPAHEAWPGHVDLAPRLFPQVTGYYSSFFKFWEACQR